MLLRLFFALSLPFFVASFLFPSSGGGGGGCCCNSAPACTPVGKFWISFINISHKIIASCGGGCSGGYSGGYSGYSSGSYSGYSSGYAQPQTSYVSAPQQASYVSAPQQASYVSAPQQASYVSAPQQASYVSVPSAGGYAKSGGPAVSSYSAPSAPAPTYNAPSAPTYNAPSAQSYNAPSAPSSSYNSPPVNVPPPPPPSEVSPAPYIGHAASGSRLQTVEEEESAAGAELDTLATSLNTTIASEPSPPIDINLLKLTNDTECNSEELREIITQNMSENLNTSKRLIQLSAGIKILIEINCICLFREQIWRPFWCELFLGKIMVFKKLMIKFLRLKYEKVLIGRLNSVCKQIL